MNIYSVAYTNDDCDRRLAWGVVLPKMKVIFNLFTIRIFTIERALRVKYSVSVSKHLSRE